MEMNITQLSTIMNKDLTQLKPTGELVVSILGSDAVQANTLFNTEFDTIVLKNSATGETLEFDIMDYFFNNLSLMGLNEEEDVKLIV